MNTLKKKKTSANLSGKVKKEFKAFDRQKPGVLYVCWHVHKIVAKASVGYFTCICYKGTGSMQHVCCGCAKCVLRLCKMCAAAMQKLC